MTRSSISAAATLCLLFTTQQPARAQCELAWSRQFVPSWPAGEVVAAVNYDDDGDGPHREAVILAGSFHNAGGVSAKSIVKWDGTWWSPLGEGLGNSTAVTVQVNDMVVFDEDGPGPARAEVWVAGYSLPSTTDVDYFLARWNGTNWAHMTPPDFGSPVRLLSHAPDGEAPSLYLAFRDGTVGVVWRFSAGVWTKLGGNLIADAIGSELPVSAMRFYDDDGPGPGAEHLFVAGSLVGSTSGPALVRIARWNGLSWEPVGDGFLPNDVTVLEVFDPDGSGPAKDLLVAAGYRSYGPSSPPTSDVQAWDGSDWTTIGTMSNSSLIPNSGTVRANSLSVFDHDGVGPAASRLWMAGRFKHVGDATYTYGMAWWDGLAWHSPNWSDPDGAGFLFPLQWPDGLVSTPRLLTCANPIWGESKLFDGNAWMSLTESPFVVSARSPDPNQLSNDPLANELIAAGSFRFGADTFTYPAAHWDGYEWKPIGGRSARGTGYRIALADPDGLGPIAPTILLTGSFMLQGSNVTIKSAQLINGQWTAMPVGMPSPDLSLGVLAALDLDGPGPLAAEIYASGQLPTTPASYGIARWTGGNWEQLPGQMNAAPRCILVHDEDGEGPRPACIFVGGPRIIDGVTMNGIARWDNQTWTPLVSSMTGTVGFGSVTQFAECLGSFDPDGDGPARVMLFAGGTFGTIDGVAFNHVGYWDGLRWRPMGPGFGSSGVKSMIVMDDDGAGPRPATIFVGGVLNSSGAQTIKGFARWNGEAWDPVGPAVLGANPIPKQIFAMPGNSDWSQSPSLWGIGSFKLDGSSYNQSFVRWGIPSPFINAWPRSQSTAMGSAIALRVKAGGIEPFSYQWRRDGQLLVDGGGISGSTAQELVIASFSNQDAGQYDCVVTNECGTATSPPADVGFCTESATPDINGDGAVNGRDIQAFVMHYLAASASVASICIVDLNGNHTADASDAYALVQSMVAN